MALRTSGRASLDSRAQRALCTNQGSRPIVTICASNHGSSHVVFSLGGSGMLSPLSLSCRLAERPLTLIDLSNGLITSVERSRPVSSILSVYIESFGIITSAIPRFILFVIVYAKLAILNHIILCVKSSGLTLTLFLGSRHFSHPTHSTKNQIRRPGSKHRHCLVLVSLRIKFEFNNSKFMRVR